MSAQLTAENKEQHTLESAHLMLSINIEDTLRIKEWSPKILIHNQDICIKGAK